MRQRLRQLLPLVLIPVVSLLFFALLLPIPRQILYAQVSGAGVVFQNSDPSGACAQPTPLVYNYSLGKLWGCDGSSVYLLISASGGGAVTSIATTAPITGGPITTTGTIACPTCATTTNGGALSGSAPVQVSAAGAISLSSSSTTVNGQSCALGSTCQIGVGAYPFVAISAASGNIANSETSVVSMTGLSSLASGSTFYIRAYGSSTFTSTASSITFLVRLGTTSLNGNQPTSCSFTPVATGEPWFFDGVVTIYTTGSGGTMNGGSTCLIHTASTANTGQINQPTTTQAVNTTTTNLIELTVQTGASTTQANVYEAYIQEVK